MNQTIVVVVGPDGSTKIETHGFAGPACRVASQFLETTLGLQLQEELMPEYFQAARESTTVLQGQSSA